MDKQYLFKIIEFSNYDGDSFDLTLDLGFDLVIHRKCRLNGVDTPELRGGTELSKAAGRLARDVARKFVEDAIADGGASFSSQSYTGKFGRPLGDIVRHRDDRSLVKWLLRNHYGVRYQGQAKSEVADEHKENFQRLVSKGELVAGDFLKQGIIA